MEKLNVEISFTGISIFNLQSFTFTSSRSLFSKEIMGLLLEDDHFSSPKDIYLIHQSFGELICIWAKELKELCLPPLHLGRASTLQQYTRNLKSNF